MAPFINIIGSSIVGGGGGTLWAPSDIGSDLVGWYDGELLTGIDNDVKTSWEDQTANNFDMTKTGANDITLRTAFLNGKNVLRFPSLSYMQVPNAFSGKSAASIFLVAKKDADDDQAGFHNLSSAGAVQHFQYSDGNIYDGFFSTTRPNRGNPSFSLASWRIINIHSAGSDYNLFFDGTSFSSSGTNTVMSPVAFNFGTGQDSSFSWTGHFAEVLLVGAVLAQSIREKAEGYLAHKWGLTGNLDAGHPYKVNPPLV